MTAPYDRTSVRRTHQRITAFAQAGKYREAEYELLGASAEYRAVFAMLRLIVRLRYMTTEKHPEPA